MRKSGSDARKADDKRTDVGRPVGRLGDERWAETVGVWSKGSLEDAGAALCRESLQAEGLGAKVVDRASETLPLCSLRSADASKPERGGAPSVCRRPHSCARSARRVKARLGVPQILSQPRFCVRSLDGDKRMRKGGSGRPGPGRLPAKKTRETHHGMAVLLVSLTVPSKDNTTH